MPKRIKKELPITGIAKLLAKEALQTDAGLKPSEAKKLGIRSGRDTARYLINNKKISYIKAKQIAAFYQRFKGCYTRRCENAINLWGGRDFGRRAVKFVKEVKPSIKK